MVTDTYAHGFDEDRKLIAQEMDSGFFAKVGAKNENNETFNLLKKLITENPQLASELITKFTNNINLSSETPQHK